MATREKREAQKALNGKHTKILNDLMSKEENIYCADCTARAGRGAWASWNLGNFLCLTCSGHHRSMGVHISKVRSTNLDTWHPEWITSMQNGGNKKCNDKWEHFLPKDFKRPDEGDPDLETFIRNKYQFGKWKKGGLGPDKTPGYTGRAASGGGSSRNRATGMGPGGAPMKAAEEPKYGNGMTKREMKASTESFFADKQAANASRSSDLKPSEGGKYAGFGSSGSAHEIKNDDLMSKLSDGWSSFVTTTASAASKAATTINDSVIAPAKEKLAEGDLLNSMTENIKLAANKVQEKVSSLSGSSTGSRSGRNRGRSEPQLEEPGPDDFFSSELAPEPVEPNSRSSRSSSNSRSSRSTKTAPSRAKTADWDDDGWGDGWGDDATSSKPKRSTSTPAGSKATARSRAKPAAKPKKDDDWGDDDW